MPLPLKDKIVLPNNKTMALKRLSSLKGKLMRNSQLREDYAKFMADMIRLGYAEPVLADELVTAGKKWYIPHHSVYHARKPDKTSQIGAVTARKITPYIG